jgi:homeobox protein cut-like
MTDFQTKLRSPSVSSAPKPNNEASIVPILTSQRDRYRQRFEESQRTSLDLSSKITNLQEQIEKLQQDNVSLYEKLRYQENYRGSWQQSSVVNIESNPRSRYEDVSAKYKDKYEATMDPFRHFKQVCQFGLINLVSRKRIRELKT